MSAGRTFNIKKDVVVDNLRVLTRNKLPLTNTLPALAQRGSLVAKLNDTRWDLYYADGIEWIKLSSSGSSSGTTNVLVSSFHDTTVASTDGEETPVPFNNDLFDASDVHDPVGSPTDFVNSSASTQYWNVYYSLNIQSSTGATVTAWLTIDGDATSRFGSTSFDAQASLLNSSFSGSALLEVPATTGTIVLNVMALGGNIVIGSTTNRFFNRLQIFQFSSP